LFIESITWKFVVHYDVFNGDADGIIALLQIRLNEPKPSRLITGVKRDIQLLARVPKDDVSSMTVLDVSLDRNSAALERLLEAKIPVTYIDHHRATLLPSSKYLTSHIDVSASTCTSLIVNQLLKGKYQNWAIAAAFGDNLIDVASRLSKTSGHSEEQIKQLRQLGKLINYNGYGASLDDLHFHPKELYQELLAYHDPFDVIADPVSPYHQLVAGYQHDLLVVNQAEMLHQSSILEVCLLPDSSSSRRIIGEYSNQLVRQQPEKAHIILSKQAATDDRATPQYTLSLRAPLNQPHSAGAICSAFSCGGGREIAAGINNLSLGELNDVIKLTEKTYLNGAMQISE
jgi:hypothetical protein